MAEQPFVEGKPGPAAPVPPDETDRLSALHRCRILDTPPDPAFDAVTQIAARLCAVPIAAISLVDANRQWFKSAIGLPCSETPRDMAICAHAILGDGPLVIADTCEDERTRANPLVTAEGGIRFYAGLPLRLTPRGSALGALCVIDTRPRELTEPMLEHLADLAGQTARLIEMRRQIADIEDARSESAARLELSMIGASQAAWDWNLLTNAIVFSDTWYTMLGYAPRELPMTLHTWEQLVHPEDMRGALDALDAHLTASSDHFDAEIRMRHKSGAWRWVRTVGRAFGRDDSGRPTRVAGMHIDIDAAKRVQRELEQKNAELERFAYTASHDLKTPIVSIVGYTGHLLRDLENGRLDRLPHFGSRIREAAGQMHASVDGLLELSRVDNGRIAPRWLALQPLVEAVWSKVRPAATGRTPRLTMSLGLTAIRLEPVHATQLLQNLLENALRHGCRDDDGVVEVGTERRDDRASLYVRDHGPGVPPEHRDRVFGLFERLVDDGTGTGVGLAIVRRVAEVNDGSVTVDDTPGGGATFRVDLPPDRFALVEDVLDEAALALAS